MKKFNGYEDAKKAAEYTGSEKLPAGGYVCNVMGVRYDTFDWGDVIVLQFDIAEGEYKGFFKKQYDANTSDDKKYKGTARINVPKDDGSEKDGWTKNAFARWTNAFEKSNPGYTWDWDETKWKGKTVGILFGETGTVIGGKSVKFTEARTACSVEDVKTNNFWDGYIKFKARDGYSENQLAKTDSNGFMQIPDNAPEEIPF